MPVNVLFILQLGSIPAFTLRFKTVTKNVWEHKLENAPPPPTSPSQETPGSAKWEASEQPPSGVWPLLSHLMQTKEAVLGPYKAMHRNMGGLSSTAVTYVLLRS